MNTLNKQLIDLKSTKIINMIKYVNFISSFSPSNIGLKQIIRKTMKTDLDVSEIIAGISSDSSRNTLMNEVTQVSTEYQRLFQNNAKEAREYLDRMKKHFNQIEL
jgi:hypothetical protein